MDSVPNSAIAMAVGLLVVIWVFLVHMMMSQEPDAHLQFLLDLMGESEELSKSSPPRGSSPCLPDDNRMVAAPVTAESATVGTKPDSPQFLGREVPLLFATSLRGRGL
jgi:hypothetical protein